MFAHRPDAEAERSVEEHVLGQDYQNEGQVDGGRPPADDPAQDGDPFDERQVPVGELGHLGRMPGMLEETAEEEAGQGQGQDVQSHAAHHLAAAEADRGEGMDRSEGHPGQAAQEETPPGGSGKVGAGHGGEGAHEHYSFQTHVDHPGPLAEDPAQGGEDEGGGHAQGRDEEQDEGVYEYSRGIKRGRQSSPPP